MLASDQRTGALDGSLVQIIYNQHQDASANAPATISVAPSPHASYAETRMGLPLTA